MSIRFGADMRPSFVDLQKQVFITAMEDEFGKYYNASWTELGKRYDCFLTEPLEAFKLFKNLTR